MWIFNAPGSFFSFSPLTSYVKKTSLQMLFLPWLDAQSVSVFANNTKGRRAISGIECRMPRPFSHNAKPQLGQPFSTLTEP